MHHWEKLISLGYLAASVLIFVTGCASDCCQSDQQGKSDAATTATKLGSSLLPVAMLEPHQPVAGSARSMGNSASALSENKIVQVAHHEPTKGPSEPVSPGDLSKSELLPAPRPNLTDSPVPVSSESSLSLDRVINTTLLADPKLQAGFQAISQAKGDARTASLRPNPVLYFDTQLLPLTRPFTPTDQGGPPQTDVYLSYPIDWFLFGKRAAAMQAAALGVRSSEATFADLVRTRVLEAALAYYDVVEAKALLDLARQVVKNYQQVEATTEKAIREGGRPRVELSRIRLSLLNSMQNLRNAENALVGARARLWAIMGQTGTAPEFDVGGTLDNLPQIEPLPIEQAVVVAQENRPDIQALRLKFDSARADIVVEDRKAYPDVMPLIGYTRQYQQHTIGFPDASSYIVAFTTSLPVFNRNQGNRAKAKSIAVQSQYELQTGLVALQAEIVQITKELQTASANARAVAGEQLQLARQVRDSLNKAYEAGGRPLIDVFNAQQDYQQTFQLYITTRANYGRAIVKYWAALAKKVAS